MDCKARVMSKTPMGNGVYKVTERRRVRAAMVMRLALPAMNKRGLPKTQVRKWDTNGNWCWVNAVAEFGWEWCASSGCYRHRRGGKGVPLASVLRYVAQANPQCRDFEIDTATGDGYYTSTSELDCGVLAKWFSIPAK